MANKRKRTNEEVINNVEKETKEEMAVEVIEEPAVFFGTVTNCSKLNVRSGKNIKSAVLEVIDCGSEVEITDRYDGWYGVVTANQTKGFCMREYIKI